MGVGVSQVIGFVGAGNMATALIRGLLSEGVVNAGQLWATNRSHEGRLRGLQETYGVAITRRKTELVDAASTLILAVKPADMAEVLTDLGPLVNGAHLIISVAAGIPLRTLASALPQSVVVRAMPNTSAAVHKSATAISAGASAREHDLTTTEAIFRAVGDVIRVDEDLLDVITGLSGSGPAYVYRLIEAMIDAGTGLGVESALARRLAIQTLVGAARMLEGSNEDPGDLRRRVTSPGGTTMAGLQALEERGFADAVREAVTRAAKRSREMADEFEPNDPAARRSEA